MQDKSGKKVITIPLFAVVLFIAFIILFLLKVNSIGFNENKQEMVSNEKANESNENKDEEGIEKNSNNVEVAQEKEDTQIVNTENIESTEQNTQITNQENENQNVRTYTASNGKTYDSIGIIEIPSLNIKYPILSTTTDSLLKVSVTKYWGGNPNEVGNLCILGHNYKNSKFFGKLPNIEEGATIKITDLNGKTLNYRVYDTYAIDEDDNSCTTQLTNGNIEVTLITCYYENGSAHATKRFVVKARAN